MKSNLASKQHSKSKKSIPVKSRPGNSNNESQGNYWIYLIAILVLTAFVFSPILKNGFTNWDDPTYIANNPLIKDLSLANIKRIFSEVYFANYQPLHILSYAIEYHFFEMNASGYHAVSLVMHLINVVLVFYFIKKLSGNEIIALVTCLLFAINPLRTESVAWAAERKDLLYSMFFFAALIQYLNYIQSGKDSSLQMKYLFYAFFLFVLSVFSKAMAVSLVPVLFLLDFYQGRKFDIKCFLEKIPFVLLALIMGWVSVRASSDEGSIDTTSSYTFIDRIFFACHNLLMYMIKSIVPFQQSAFYQYPEKVNESLSIEYYLAGIVALALAAYTFYSLKSGRRFFFAITFFVLTVFLVLMLIPVGPTVFSERYSFIPSVALFFLISSYAVNFMMDNVKLKSWGIVVLVTVTSVYSVLAYQRCKVWKDSITLWDDVLQQFPKAPHALNNRGDAYFQLGQADVALKDFTAAINANRTYAQAWYNRGNAYGQLGKAKEAFTDLNEAIRLNPQNGEAFNKRGQANGVLGNFDAAISDFKTALNLKPDLTEVYFNLGITYINAKKKDEACEYLKKAVDAGFEKALQPYREVCGK